MNKEIVLNNLNDILELELAGVDAVDAALDMLLDNPYRISSRLKNYFIFI